DHRLEDDLVGHWVRRRCHARTRAAESQRWAVAQYDIRRRGRPDVQLPALHDAPALCVAGTDGSTADRGGRGPLLLTVYRLSQGDLPAVDAWRCRGHPADLPF